MPPLNYTALIIPGESLSVTHDGNTTNLPADAPNFDALVQLLRKQAPFEEIAKVLTPAVQIKAVAAEAGFEIRINESSGAVGIFFKGEEINSKLSDLILDHYQSGNDFVPLRNFMLKALSNRDAAEADILYSFVVNNKLPIHNDGDFLAFKATRPDGLDKHTGTVRYRIGEYLHVTNANPDKNTQCSTGLHIGGRNYVNWYGGTGDAHWIVKVNPADTIFYRADAGEGKMRVKRLFVYAQISKPETLDAFLPFMVAHSPEGDVLETAAKNGRISKKTEGRSSQVAKQAAKGRTKTEKKNIKVAKKAQSFVSNTTSEQKFTAKNGNTYTAGYLLEQIKAQGQRGFAALTGIPRTTIQGWLALIKDGEGRKR